MDTTRWGQCSRCGPPSTGHLSARSWRAQGPVRERAFPDLSSPLNAGAWVDSGGRKVELPEGGRSRELPQVDVGWGAEGLLTVSGDSQAGLGHVCACMCESNAKASAPTLEPRVSAFPLLCTAPPGPVAAAVVCCSQAGLRCKFLGTSGWKRRSEILTGIKAVHVCPCACMPVQVCRILQRLT